VYISGGPGSPLTAFTDYQARHPYAESRDLILVDQRGVGRSEPVLCPGVAGELLQTDFAVAATPTAAVQAQRRSVLMTCRNEAKVQGIDLDGFGTAATVEDFDQVRQALGITRWNVVGNSYGTTVAMTLMAQHPATIRSAVLDSVYPPDPIPPWSARVAEARAAFFAMCARDAACAAAYPNLAGLYTQVLDRLGRVPLTVEVPSQMRQAGVVRLFEGGRLRGEDGPRSPDSRSAGHVPPDLEGGVASGAVLDGGQAVATELEMVVDAGVGGQEALGMAR